VVCYYKKELVLKAFENEVLNKIFGPKQRDMNENVRYIILPIFS